MRLMVRHTVILLIFQRYNCSWKNRTPETGTGTSNALFIAYAPADDPEIAVAVVIEKGVWGSNAVQLELMY